MTVPEEIPLAERGTMKGNERQEIVRLCKLHNVSITYDHDREGHNVTFYHGEGPKADYTTTYNYTRALRMILAVEIDRHELKGWWSV